MKNTKQALYRELLHWAMIDARMHSASASGTLRSLLGRRWRSHRQVNGFIYALTNWLHNVARYSAIDFEGFREEWFWEEYRRFRSQYPANRWAALTETIIQQLLAATDEP